jgi:Ca-activated chloride channel family protein
MLFEDSQWQATARYRSEDYPGAAEGFAAEGSTKGTYNLGNALARQGDFETAIAAYSEVLNRAPDHTDAAFNKALVERLLEEQQSSQQDNPQRDQGGENSEDSSSGGGSPEQSQNQQAGQEPDQQSDPQNAESEQSESQDRNQGDTTEDLAESRDEQKDALEQWLRRVPDDPGGLLRRKFRYETNQRLRSGDYRDQQSDKIW